jgi:hypothetical protein
MSHEWADYGSDLDAYLPKNHNTAQNLIRIGHEYGSNLYLAGLRLAAIPT